MTAADGTNRNGIDSVDTFSMTFGALANTETIICAVITATGGSSGATAAEVAAFFASETDGQQGNDASNKITRSSGAITGFSTAAVTGTSTVVFTATTAGTALTAATGTQSASNTLAAGTGGTASNSAYRSTVSSVESGILFYGSTPTRIDITSVANATQAITELDAAINGAAAEKAKLGSFMSRLTHASDNLQNISTNTSASLSRIADADYASETTELARTQIISQASTAMLAQANQVKQTVLSLLQ
jgi:flagellin